MERNYIYSFVHPGTRSVIDVPYGQLSTFEEITGKGEVGISATSLADNLRSNYSYIVIRGTIIVL